ncbi:MAG: hypothetical protein MZV63_60495 [Marinilabiliales bacterium]|nr:hypothetical protein [Marinilabiliales bacterium]
MSGSSTIIQAAGQGGKKAAFYLDKYLQGTGVRVTYAFGDKLPAVDKQQSALHGPDITIQTGAWTRSCVPGSTNGSGISGRWSLTFTEEEVRRGARSLLDCSGCRECHQCVTACPANAIDFSQKEETVKSAINQQL